MFLYYFKLDLWYQMQRWVTIRGEVGIVFSILIPKFLNPKSFQSQSWIGNSNAFKYFDHPEFSDMFRTYSDKKISNYSTINIPFFKVVLYLIVSFGYILFIVFLITHVYIKKISTYQKLRKNNRFNVWKSSRIFKYL